MIASIATEVLPVWRSPMMSSRWPRPIGIIPSIDLSPVWTGVFTGWRSTTLQAVNASDAVGDRQHGPDLREIGALGLQALDPLAEDARDLVRLDLQLGQLLVSQAALA